MSFFGKLFSSAPTADEETAKLIREVEGLRAGSTCFQPGEETDLPALVMADVGDSEDASLGTRIGLPVYRLLRDLYEAETFTFVPGPLRPEASLAAGAALRATLRQIKTQLENEEYFVDKWSNAIGGILTGMYREFPEEAFVDPDADGNFEEYSALAPTAPLYTYISDLPGMLSKIISTMFSRGLPEDGLFDALREQFHERICLASNVDPRDPKIREKRLLLPDQKKGASDAELIDLYLTGTPFRTLLTAPIPLRIPEAVRFEHTHILAGTGHGKTQLLQYLIAADLEKAISERRSIVVMDGQGDLLRALLHSGFFKDEKLRESLIYIDPTDTLRPVGLNLFDIGNDLLHGPGSAERETVLNATIELYEYFFGGLLGAELTARQGLIFRFIAALMTQIPGANIHTLRELMEDGERFRPYMEKLTGSARVFFETKFFERGFSETKKQIGSRLWGVLSNQSLDRMMSARKNSVDLFSALQRGSIVFINTARDFFGHEGSTIFSRMFVALLGQALMRRATVARHERTPTYIYIDEAEAVVDVTLTRMLAQVRKYKGAITFAHQNLDQLPSEIRAGVLANTSIKLAGGLSAKDASALAGDFRCEPSFLLGQRKGKTETHFACYAKNVTDRAVSLSVPLGYVESGPRISERSYQELIEVSRQRYGMPVEEVEAPPPKARPAPREEVRQAVPPAPTVATPAAPPILEPALPTFRTPAPVEVPPATPPQPEPIPTKPLALHGAGGKGGVKHRYLQALVKELAEARGFLTVLEQPVHNGTGQVDVSLLRGETRLAFEISVTTTKDHELGNIEKCLALPYTHVVMLASHARHLKGLSTHIGAALEEGDRKRVSFLLPEEVPGFLDGYQVTGPVTERQVKGYTVRSKVVASDAAEAAARRKAIAKVVGRAAV